MTDHDAPDRETLRRFLAGETSPEEAAELLRWAQSRPPFDPRRIWENIAAEVQEDAPTPTRMTRTTPSLGTRAFVSRSRSWGIAAVASALIVAGISMYAKFADRSTTAIVVAAREYRTERGQRASVKLPDGSAVQLGPQTTLRLEPNYASPNRTVTLSGEAYFHVTHDPTRPFLVRTARGEIRDLGTRFVVRARPEHDIVEVAVSEGRVAITPVGRLSDSIAIAAGELARLDGAGRVTATRVKSIDDYFAWTEGRLRFDRAPLPQVLEELSRWYDTEFVLADKSLKATRLTTVLRGETLSEALVVLQNALDVDTRFEGRTVILAKRSP